MNENPWNTPEAIAYFQSEYDHAIKKAKEALANACAWNGPLHQMGKLPGELLDEVADQLGADNYRLLVDLIISAPLVKEFLDAGETGKL